MIIFPTGSSEKSNKTKNLFIICLDSLLGFIGVSQWLLDSEKWPLLLKGAITLGIIFFFLVSHPIIADGSPVTVKIIVLAIFGISLVAIILCVNYYFFPSKDRGKTDMFPSPAIMQVVISITPTPSDRKELTPTPSATPSPETTNHLTSVLIDTPTPESNVGYSPTPSNSPTLAGFFGSSADDNMLDSYNKGMVAYRKQDYGTAFPYLLQAATIGYAPAQYQVGECYRRGAGVKVNKEKAFGWYKLSADQYYANGLLCMGYCYHYGDGVVQDYDLAKAYYLAAQEAGHPNANDSLAMLEVSMAN